MDRRTFVGLLGALTATACSRGSVRPAQPFCSSARTDLPMRDELDELVLTGMKRLESVPGLALAVYSPEGSYARGFGITDVQTNEPVDAQTAFYIASATKPLTALALLRCEEQGRINLDQAISTFSPDAALPPDIVRGVRFRALLSHTSGIENDPIAFRVALSGQHDPALLWRLLKASKVNSSAPLGQFDYTNTGYNLATVLTDHQFGLPWQQLLQDQLFAPLCMSHTSARMSEATRLDWRVAKPHTAMPSGLARCYLEKTDRTMHSAGGVIMSAQDACALLELMCEDGVHAGKRLLSVASINAARAPTARVTEGTQYAGYNRETYGLGWYQGPFQGEQLFHHFGGFAGVRAHLSHIPARRIGVAAFVNEDLLAGSFSDAVANFVYERSAGRAQAHANFNAKLDQLIEMKSKFHTHIAADQAKRRARAWTLTSPISAYAGRYENQDFGRMEITVEAQALRVQFGALSALATQAVEPNAIRVELVPNTGESIEFAQAERPQELRYDGQIYTRI